MTTDKEFEILNSVADYVVSDNKSNYPLTGDEIINFGNIIYEFAKLSILDDTNFI